MTNEALESGRRPRDALFRSAAVERMSTPERLDVAAAIVRPTAWLLLLTAMILLVAAVAAGILIDIPIKVEVGGVLLNAAGAKEIVAIEGGLIKSLKVRVGDKVKVGDVVALLDQPDLRQQVESAAADAREARDQLAKVTDFQNTSGASQDSYLDQQRQTLAASVGFAQQRVQWLTDRMSGLVAQADKGAITKQKLLDARLELSQANEELGRNRNALKQLDAEEDMQRNVRQRERLALELKVTSAEGQLAQLAQRLNRGNLVTSAYTGTVAELKFNEGELIDRGAAILTVIPDGAGLDLAGKPHLVAVLFVPPGEGKKIKPGMAVEVLPATTKREESGFIIAKVAFVSEVPASQEGMLRELKNKQLVQTLSADGAPFEVRAELTGSAKTPSGLEWSTSRGPDTQITDFTPCRAEIVTRSEPALQLLIPATRPLFDMMRK
jgi:HlyD family secretion protein